MMDLLLIAGAIALNAVIVGLLIWAARSIRYSGDGCGNVGDKQ